jgi:hypothetical protein
MTINKKLINKYEGWTEEAKEGAKHAAALGHELEDFSDSGDDLEELADIMDLNSPRYDNIKKSTKK